MLDNVDIYAPFREDAEENAYRPKKYENDDDVETVCVGLGFQTSLGFVYEINIPCKPSTRNPNFPDLKDFKIKMRALAKNFDIDKEAKKMYRRMKGKIPLEKLRDVANEAYHIITSIEPSQFLSFLRRGGGEINPD